MSGKAYGVSLPIGIRGTVTRVADEVIGPFCHVGDDPIQYGAAVMYDATNKGVRKVLESDSAGTKIIGIAVRSIGQPKADNPNGYYYEKGETVDVLLRGSIAVELEEATGIAAMGQVYVNPTTGELTAKADHTPQGGSKVDHLAVPNCVFATGAVDANNVAEVTITKRSI